MTTPESAIKRQVTAALKTFGCDVWYFYPGNNGFGKSGIPDLIVCAGGHFIGVEVKSGINKKPTKLQALQGSRIKSAQGTWVLVRCKEDVADLVSYIKELLSICPIPLPIKI